MKTSVIEVHDMLSVLSVLGVEKRIGEVPGVESVTVNYAAGSATVRYDETRLEIADIKSAVRQSGYESAARRFGGRRSQASARRPPAAPAPAAPKSAPEAAASKTVTCCAETFAGAPRPRPQRRNQPRTPLPRPRAPLLQATDNKTKRRRTKVRTTLVLRSCL